MINIYAMISGHQLLLGYAQFVDSQVSIPSGGSGTDTIIISFSGQEWTEAATKKASFWRKDAPDQVSHVTLTDDTVIIPLEVLAKPGIVYVAFAGDSGSGGVTGKTKRITTNARAVIVEQGYKTEE